MKYGIMAKLFCGLIFIVLSLQSANAFQTSTPPGVPTGLIERIPLNVPITIKETAGVDGNNYPVDVVVPLPINGFSSVDNFRIADAEEKTVDAQFNIINRWNDKDKSIRHVKVHFQPSVSPYTGAPNSGRTVYYLRNDGGGYSMSTELTVDTSNPDIITVITGPLKFTINKNRFTIIDQAWLDTNNNHSFDDETPILKSEISNGGDYEGLWGQQLDSARDDITYTIEESGPMRAVIKAWAPTLYYGADYMDEGDGMDPAHQHGFAVRIYAYAGKSFVKVDYQLQNAAKNSKWSWPLYFDHLNLNFALNMSPAGIRVRADQGDGAVESGMLENYSNGLILKNIGPVTATDDSLRSTPDSIFRIEEGNGTLLDTWEIDEADLYDAPPMSTFMDVDNGSVGIAITMRNFWQMWPNGLQVDADGTLRIQMWPEWSCYWNDDGGHLGQLGSCTDEDPKARWGSYFLFDMQYTYKEALIFFHDTGTTESELRNWAKTAQYYPVGTIPTAQWKSASATLDMGGMIPVDEKLSVTDQRRPSYKANDFDLSDSGCRRNNKFGWNSFYFDDKPRKYAPSTTGGQPYTAAALITSENPSDYWRSLDHGMASINISLQSMSEDYTYADDWDELHLQSRVYPGAYWRSQGAPFNNFLDAPWLTGTYLMQKSRDDAHGWWYHAEYSYYLTGNPWIRDWYEFIAEFRKGTLNNPTLAGGQSRAVGHHLGHAFQAYRVTGDEELLNGIQTYINNSLRPESVGGVDPGAAVVLQNAQYGHIPFVSGDDMPYMMSFLLRQIMTYMDEIKYTDPQAWAEAFQFVSGQISANIKYLNWDYRCDPIEGLNNKGETCRSNAISAYILADPASWYYAITGKPEVLANLKDYLDDGINGGDYPNTSKYLSWSDEFTGRWTKYILEKEPLRSDMTPPASITDLSAKQSREGIILTFTPPADAVRYHVVYSDKPISENSNPSTEVCNWWAAGTVGTLEIPQTIVPETAAHYVAVFTFDSYGNMSGMSNVSNVAP
ncbi:MAG: hypothetical protein JXR49_16195 [Acidobacteria bacterium]|nr:hypothetical protein [Acidobacteriota bacterium]